MTIRQIIIGGRFSCHWPALTIVRQRYPGAEVKEFRLTPVRPFGSPAESWGDIYIYHQSINGTCMAPKTPKVEAKKPAKAEEKNSAKSKKAVTQVKKEAAAKAKKTVAKEKVTKVKVVKDEASKSKAVHKAAVKKESSAKAKKAIEKIKAKKLADANYRKGVEEMEAKKMALAVKPTPVVKKLSAKERKAESARDLKKTELKVKAETSSHKEHEKQPQPRWK